MVLSSLPPSPVSITARSTFLSANQLKAIPVVISKKDSPSVDWRCRRERISLFSGIRNEAPLMIFILSRKSTRWGEVYSPTLAPRLERAAESIEQTEPLPLVPATCMQGYFCQGLPSALS